jgi:ketosteroid isomerase-like protein
MTDLAARIDRLEAQTAVSELIYAYAKFIRADQPERVAGLFLPDATFEIRDGHPDRDEHTVRTLHRGRAEIDASMSAMKGKPHPVPLIRNLVVEVDGDTARANSVMDARIYGTNHALAGEYHDTCRRVEGKWYFASRRYTIYKDA